MVIRVAVLALIVLGGAFGALQARLAHSPISMSFLVPPIEKAVNRTLSGLHFDIGDAVLRRSESGFGVEFRLTDVKLVDDSSSPVAESPFASANVSVGALLLGRLAASHINLIGPRLYLQYSDERGLALSFADPREAKGDLRPAGDATAARHEVSPPSVTPDIDAELGPAEVTADARTRQGMIRSARGRAVSLTHALKDLFAKTRQGQSAYLQSFGIRDAVVYFEQGDQITRWAVPAAELDLRHDAGDTAVVGNISVQSPSETFDVNFRAEQNRRSGQISLRVGVEDIVPRAFTADFPGLRLPAMWNMPVTVNAEMDLGENGDILAATIDAQLKDGEFYAPWDQRHPALIDGGELTLSYSREQGLIQLSEADLRWGKSRLKLSGVLQRQRETGVWAFLFGTDEIILGAEQFGLPTIPLDKMEAQGRYDPKRGAIALDEFRMQAADAHISLAGNFVQGHNSPAIKLTGEVSPMPIAFFKLIWPKFIGNGARDWIGRRVPSGRITGGTVKIDIPAELLASLTADGHMPTEAIDMRLGLEDLEVHYVEGLPPMRIATATAQLAGQRFFFNVPKAEVTSPSGEAVQFTDGQFIVGDLRPHVPRGEIHFKSEAGAAAVMALLDHPKLGYISALKMPMPEINATTVSTFSIAMPMVRDLKFKDMKLNGRSQVQNLRATNLPGGFGVHGGTLDFDVTEKAIEAHGELKMNGMPVLVAWQRIFDAPADKQPPLRLRTVFDDKARQQLGVNLEHLIRGGAATELTVNFRKEQDPQLHFEFNLTEADLLMSSLGWRKPPGQRAVLTFDLEPVAGGAFDLRNINLQGDNLAVRGGLSVDDKRKPVAFNFPVMTLNQQTQMSISGEQGANNVWKVRIKGRSYDGRRFFKSLFSAGQIVENQPQLPEESPGVDIEADLDSVIGFFDTTLDNVKISAQRRDNKLSYLDLHGQLNGQRPLAARIESKKGEPRQILAEATDAGAAFRLVGFYPSARGGDVSLKVNLDGSGTAQQSGVLYARNFVIADDQVIDEVLSGPKQKQRAARAQKQPYEQLQFDRMRVPFSVGRGQFLLHDAAINGPLLGATMRGTIDFERERISLAGTYVPFYGINGALGLVPILGDLLISRNGEGLFGITFAVKGTTTQPDVIVNPMSVVAPGFLRQLFEFDQPTDSRIIPPDQRAEQRAGTRSSSEPPVTR